MAPETWTRCKGFCGELYRNWDRHDLGDVAGALTFQAVLAFFPFLLFCVSLASLVMDPSSVEVLVLELGRVAPPAVAVIIGNELRSLARGKRPALLTVGIVGVLWASSGGVAALTRALNRVHGVLDSRPLWKTRLLALEVTVVAAVLVVIADGLALALPIVARALGLPLGPILSVARLPVAGFVMMIVLATLYYVLPDVKQPFQLVSPGSVVAVVLWLAASYGFSIYVESFGRFEITYGALGGVVVLLLWIWISALATLLGAEINAILARHREAPCVAVPPVEAMPAEAMPAEAMPAEAMPVETMPVEIMPAEPTPNERAIVVVPAPQSTSLSRPKEAPARGVALTLGVALSFIALGAAFLLGARRSR